MSPSKSAETAPVLCLTPFYHFSSDVPELVIDNGIRLCRFDKYETVLFDEEVVKHLQMHQPDYLLWHDLLLSGDVFVDDFLPLFDKQRINEFIPFYINSSRKLFQLLRLFKPGRLRAGETFILGKGKACESWATMASGRASDMGLDFSMLAIESAPYVLNSREIPLLRAFRQNLLPLLRDMSSFPAAELALYLYGSENDKGFELVGAVTAFEALLTKKDEKEGLTYRLSMRIANLLGPNAEARKEIFLTVKKFYNLRSNIVHGAQPGLNLPNLDQAVDLVRETLRKVLLSTMALFVAGVRPVDIPGLLDELAFDDEKRRQVQATASSFLQLIAEKP